MPAASAASVRVVPPRSARKMACSHLLNFVGAAIFVFVSQNHRGPAPLSTGPLKSRAIAPVRVARSISAALQVRRHLG